MHGTCASQPQFRVRPLAFAAWTRIYRLQDGFAAAQAEERTGTVRAEFEQAPLLAFDDFGKGHFTPWVMQGGLQPV